MYLIAELSTTRATRHLEMREKGLLDSVCKGPYILHNHLVAHNEFLKKENGEEQPRTFRIFPTGGSNSGVGDVVALLAWFCVIIFPCVAIPIGCFCKNEVNMINCVVLCLLLMWHLVDIYTIFKNWKKFERMWYIAKVLTEKYLGLQNYFMNITLEDQDGLQFVPSSKRHKIFVKINENTKGKVDIMLLTLSYRRARLVLPVIFLACVSGISFVGLIIQLATMDMALFQIATVPVT